MTRRRYIPKEFAHAAADAIHEWLLRDCDQLEPPPIFRLDQLPRRELRDLWPFVN